jgi:hypothetical protein
VIKFLKTYVVAFFLGVFFTLIGFRLIQPLLNYYEEDNRLRLILLKSKLLEFRKECGSFPTVEVGLKALVDPGLEGCSAKRIMKHTDIDSFGGKMIYLMKDNVVYLVSSKGEHFHIAIKPED